MFKTILVPVDIGHANESSNVINIAAANGTVDAQIILLNVVEDIPNWVAVEMPDGFQKKSFELAQQELSKIANASDVKTKIDIRVGHPYQTILEVAKETDAELIIIASHQPGLQDYLLGSTAAKVVRHAGCSVLVVR